MNHDSPTPIRAVGPPEAVPVFNCRLYVGPSHEADRFIARAAELADLLAEGASLREAMQRLVAAFKARMIAYHSAGETPPWLESPLEKKAAESENWIAVHL